MNFSYQNQEAIGEARNKSPCADPSKSAGTDLSRVDNAKVSMISDLRPISNCWSIRFECSNRKLFYQHHLERFQSTCLSLYISFFLLPLSPTMSKYGVS